MGNDKYQSNKQADITINKKKHSFQIIPDDFPLDYDGLIGLNILEKYNYVITNDHLKLDDAITRTHTEIVVPPQSIIKEDLRINGKIHTVNMVNPTSQEVKYLPDDKMTKTLGQRLTLLKDNTRLDHIEETNRTSPEKMILSYADIFYLPGDNTPCTDLTQHLIEVTDNRPINNKSYRPPEKHKEEIDRQVKEMLEKNVIEDSNSPYNSPIWMVPKKLDASGKQKWRLVIDFRKLNEKTHLDAFPLPNIDDILDHLGNAKYFSALDLASGFHQIPMEEQSKKFTAFSTPDGHFQYKRMPFGLKNAPSTFQRMMNLAFKGLVGKNCFIYLDDIIIFGRTLEEHNKNLSIIFQRLRDTNLKVQPDKCEYLKPELEFLGHLITPEGIKTNPKKIEAVKSFKTPRNPKEVKSFLGLSGYYRKFIKDYAKTAKPLTELTRKDVDFAWTTDCENSFQTLKQKLCEGPILTYPDFSQPFTLTTDASNEGLGAILSQNKHPCCYISRTLNKAEQNYTTTEKELLAIVWAVRRLRQYLLGRKFTIETDHNALAWLFNVRIPLQNYCDGDSN